MPLYPLLIATVGYEGIIYLQAALSTLTVPLLYFVARELWQSHRAGLVAATVVAIHPVLISYVNFRLTETTFVFFLVAGLAALYQRKFLLASIALALATLTRSVFDFVIPLMIAVAAFTYGRSVIRAITVYALVYVTLMTPWWVHNYKAHGQFVRTQP